MLLLLLSLYLRPMCLLCKFQNWLKFEASYATLQRKVKCSEIVMPAALTVVHIVRKNKRVMRIFISFQLTLMQTRFLFDSTTLSCGKSIVKAQIKIFILFSLP